MLRHTAAHNPVRQPDVQRDNSGTEGNSGASLCPHIFPGGRKRVSQLAAERGGGETGEPAEVFIYRVGVGP